MKPFKVLKRERIIDEEFCRIDKEHVRFPDGTEGDWFIKQNNNAAIIIPVLKTGEILLERCYKHGCGQVIVEFPAGLIELGEDPAQGAARELLEETGYATETWHKLGEAYASPTGSPMKHIYFLAKDCIKVAEPDLEAAEQIEIELAPDMKAAKKLIQTSLSSNTAYTALQLYDLAAGKPSMTSELTFI